LIDGGNRVQGFLVLAGVLARVLRDFLLLLWPTVKGEGHIGVKGDFAMPRQAASFAGLSDRDRETLSPLPRLTDGDRVELHVRGRNGRDWIVVLPPAAISAVVEVVGRLLDGECVAVRSQDQELSPREASKILGISKSLVVLQMDRGDLPFRYVGKHRRTLLKDVLALKVELDRRQKAMKDLADEAEDLHRRYGV